MRHGRWGAGHARKENLAAFAVGHALAEHEAEKHEGKLCASVKRTVKSAEARNKFAPTYRRAFRKETGRDYEGPNFPIQEDSIQDDYLGGTQKCKKCGIAKGFWGKTSKASEMALLAEYQRQQHSGDDRDYDTWLKEEFMNYKVGYPEKYWDVAR